MPLLQPHHSTIPTRSTAPFQLRRPPTTTRRDAPATATYATPTTNKNDDHEVFAAATPRPHHDDTAATRRTSPTRHIRDAGPRPRLAVRALVQHRRGHTRTARPCSHIRRRCRAPMHTAKTGFRLAPREMRRLHPHRPWLHAAHAIQSLQLPFGLAERSHDDGNPHRLERHEVPPKATDCNARRRPIGWALKEGPSHDFICHVHTSSGQATASTTVDQVTIMLQERANKSGTNPTHRGDSTVPHRVRLAITTCIAVDERRLPKLPPTTTLYTATSHRFRKAHDTLRLGSSTIVRGGMGKEGHGSAITIDDQLAASRRDTGSGCRTKSRFITPTSIRIGTTPITSSAAAHVTFGSTRGPR